MTVQNNGGGVVDGGEPEEYKEHCNVHSSSTQKANNEQDQFLMLPSIDQGLKICTTMCALIFHQESCN